MYIDLTKTIYHQMENYKDDPMVTLTQIKHLKEDGYNDYVLSINMHSGTHIDGINHMKPHQTIDYESLENLIGIGRKVNPLDFVYNGEEVLIIETNGQYLPESFIEKVVIHPIKFIVIDSESPDDYPYHIHHKLFSHHILIVENAMNLDKLKNDVLYKVYAIPLKIKSDSSPIRLFAEALK